MQFDFKKYVERRHKTNVPREQMLIKSSANCAYTILNQDFIKVQIDEKKDDVFLDAFNNFIIRQERKRLKSFSELIDVFTVQVVQPSPSTSILKIGDQTNLRGSKTMKACALAAINGIDIYTILSKHRVDMGLFLSTLEKLFSDMTSLSSSSGFIHNDAHLGNILLCSKTFKFILIDYGRVLFDKTVYVKTQCVEFLELLPQPNNTVKKLAEISKTYINGKKGAFVYDVSTISMNILCYHLGYGKDYEIYSDRDRININFNSNNIFITFREEHSTLLNAIEFIHTMYETLKNPLLIGLYVFLIWVAKKVQPFHDIKNSRRKNITFYPHIIKYERKTITIFFDALVKDHYMWKYFQCYPLPRELPHDLNINVHDAKRIKPDKSKPMSTKIHTSKENVPTEIWERFEKDSNIQDPDLFLFLDESLEKIIDLIDVGSVDVQFRNNIEHYTTKCKIVVNSIKEARKLVDMSIANELFMLYKPLCTFFNAHILAVLPDNFNYLFEQAFFSTDVFKQIDSLVATLVKFLAGQSVQADKADGYKTQQGGTNQQISTRSLGPYYYQRRSTHLKPIPEPAADPVLLAYHTWWMYYLGDQKTGPPEDVMLHIFNHKY